MEQFDSDAQIKLNAAALLFNTCAKKFDAGELDPDAFHAAVGKYVKKLPDAPVPIPVPRQDNTKPPKPPVTDKNPPPNKAKGKGKRGVKSKDEGDEQAEKGATAG